MKTLYADIIIEISHEKLDKSFQYRIPPELCGKVKIGTRVKIPFGRGSGEKLILGYCVSIGESPLIDPFKIKEIAEISAPDYEKEPMEQLIALAAWMKSHYGGTLIQALKTVLPVRSKVKKKEKTEISLSIEQDQAMEYSAEFNRKHQVARLRLIKALIEYPEIDMSVARTQLNIPANTIRSMEAKGIISVRKSEVARLPDQNNGQNPGFSKKLLGSGDQYNGEGPASCRLVLNPDQEMAVARFQRDFENGIRQTYLIHGITGSGKTQVYIEIMEKAIDKGYQAILLIPEISLTFQTVMRIKARFGERVSYLNSSMSKGERHDVFNLAAANELDIIVGPRSALFTPFPRLGVIIIDEEHEGSYKADSMPKYHARETAIERARLAGASVVMGSATPSVDAYYRAQRGEYLLVGLFKRAGDGELPKVEVVDMRQEFMKGNKSMFSDSLSEKIGDRLKKKEQVMLFLNRRGYSGFVSCRKCGFVFKCPHCDVALSSHRDNKGTGWLLKCHYCGYSERNPKNCPECGSIYIGGMRAGTEQVEESLKSKFPGARIIRMDSDTTSRKGDYEKLLQVFANEEADVMIGTQMIVKGHDFPSVTLVGVLAADLSLYAADYRAGERTFDLLTQAAGRAGRGKMAGEVVIQTYSPGNFAIAAAARQDYNDFYCQEIAFRKLMKYPPVSHLLKVLIEDKNESRAIESASNLAKRVKEPNDTEDIVCIGPAPDTKAKLQDYYRQAFYVKNGDTEILSKIKDRVELEAKKLSYSTRVSFDFDPI